MQFISQNLRHTNSCRSHWLISLIIFLLLIFCNICIPQIDDEQYEAKITFAQITDTHVFDAGARSMSPYIFSYRKQFASANENLKKVIWTLNSLGPDFVVNTGDFIDFFLPENPIYFLKYMEQIEAPVYYILGNHENHEPRSRSFWKTLLGFSNTYYSFNKPLETAEGEGKVIYHFIALDDNYFFPLSDTTILWDQQGQETEFGIDNVQLNWLRHDLAANRDKPTIILFHVPLKVGDTNNDGVYFIQNQYKWFTHQGDQSDHAVFDLIADNPQIKLIVTGHNHENVIEQLPSKYHSIPMVCTDALFENPDFYRIFNLFKDRIEICKTGSTEPEMVYRFPVIKSTKDQMFDQIQLNGFTSLLGGVTGTLCYYRSWGQTFTTGREANTIKEIQVKIRIMSDITRKPISMSIFDKIGGNVLSTAENKILLGKPIDEYWFSFKFDQKIKPETQYYFKMTTKENWDYYHVLGSPYNPYLTGQAYVDDAPLRQADLCFRIITEK